MARRARRARHVPQRIEQAGFHEEIKEVRERFDGRPSNRNLRDFSVNSPISQCTFSTADTPARSAPLELREEFVDLHSPLGQPIIEGGLAEDVHRPSILLQSVRVVGRAEQPRGVFHFFDQPR